MLSGVWCVRYNKSILIYFWPCKHRFDPVLNSVAQKTQGDLDGYFWLCWFQKTPQNNNKNIFQFKIHLVSLSFPRKWTDPFTNESPKLPWRSCVWKHLTSAVLILGLVFHKLSTIIYYHFAHSSRNNWCNLIRFVGLLVQTCFFSFTKIVMESGLGFTPVPSLCCTVRIIELQEDLAVTHDPCLLILLQYLKINLLPLDDIYGTVFSKAPQVSCPAKRPANIMLPPLRVQSLSFLWTPN